jgi:hypothetical protein
MLHGVLAVSAAASALAIGLEPHSCSLVSIVHTNLSPSEAMAVQAIYSEVTEHSGNKPEPIGTRLSESRGGFWDVFFMGAAFSYAVYCSEYVELASDVWNVLLCRESEDREALHCGSRGLTLYQNGTLLPERPELNGRRVAVTPSMYKNYIMPPEERPDAEKARMPVLVETIDAWTYDLISQPNSADRLRREVGRSLPWAGSEAGGGALWNVLIEREAGGHFYYSEEEFHVELREASLRVTIFDRRCHTTQLVDGRPD